MYERTGTFLTSPATDLWAVGALAYRLLVGRDWDGSHISPPDDSRYVHSRILFLEEDGWADRSPSSREFLRRIMVPLQSRMTAAQALTMRWLRLFAIPMPGPNSEPPTPPQQDARYLIIVCLLLQAPRLISREELEALHRAFEQCDADKDNLISRGELFLHLIKQEVDEEYASAILDVVDLRNVGVIDFATFVVGNLGARQDDMDPERIAFETFQLMAATETKGKMEKGGITMKEASQLVMNSGTGALEHYMDVRYLTLLQPIRTASQRSRVPFQDFMQVMQHHVAQGTPFAPEDPEEDMDDIDDLDSWPLDGLLMNYLRDAADSVRGFDLCSLCKVNRKRRHSKDLTGLGDI